MRDIRSDLQERAALVDEQIRSAYTRFEEAVRQLQIERDERIGELKSDLAVIEEFLELEQRYSGNLSAKGRLLPEIKSSADAESPLLSLANIFLRLLKNGARRQNASSSNSQCRKAILPTPNSRCRAFTPCS